MDDLGSEDQHIDRLNPPDWVVLEEMRSGAGSASCSVLEQDGEVGYVSRVDDDALASVTYRPSEGISAVVKTVPLSWVLCIAAEGAAIERVCAPDLESWTWTAAAGVITEQILPTDLILPVPIRRRRLWLLVARDDRGMSGVLHSRDWSISNRGALGDVVANQVSRTTIEGAAARLAGARRSTDPSTFLQVIAGSVADYFSSDRALSGSDGGQPLLQYEIKSFDPTVGGWEVVAAYPPGTTEAAIPRRRAGLSGAALLALETEVFGSGVNSQRARWPVASLDEPIRANPPGGSTTLGDTVAGSEDPADAVERKLELGELVARAGLSPREREVVRLKADDHSEIEIAEILGIARGTASSLWTRSRRKLAKAAESPQSEM